MKDLAYELKANKYKGTFISTAKRKSEFESREDDKQFSLMGSEKKRSPGPADYDQTWKQTFSRLEQIYQVKKPNKKGSISVLPGFSIGTAKKDIDHYSSSMYDKNVLYKLQGQDGPGPA